MKKAVEHSLSVAVAAALLLGCQPVANENGRDERSSALASSHAVAASPRGVLEPYELGKLAAALLARHSSNQAFDPALACFPLASPEGTPYCLSLANVAMVSEDGRELLYVLATNVTPADSDIYQYGHASAGLVRAFAAELRADGRLGQDVAAMPGALFGSNGSTGAEDATLLRIGANQHAWYFVSGGVWQGIASTQHVLLARQGAAFVNVSTIPEFEESDQSHRYDIAVDGTDPARERFPLIVSKSTVDMNSLTPDATAELLQQWTVERDAATGLYRMPNESEKESMP